MREREPRQHPAAAVLAEPAGEGGIAQETDDGVGKRHVVAGRDPESGLLVKDRVAVTADVGDDHGPRQQERLQRATEVVVQRRVHGDVERRQDVGDVAPLARKEDRAGDAEGTCKLFQLLLVR